MLKVTCPNCQKSLQIPEHLAGRSGTCTGCGGRLVAPAAAEYPEGRSREDILREQQGEPVWTGLDSGDTIPAPDGIRIGAGMVATEGESGGRGRASAARMATLGCLLLVVVACVLPAIVIGFSAETSPPKPARKSVVPVARGTLPVETPAIDPNKSQAEDTGAQEIRPVYVDASGDLYHTADCALRKTAGSAISLGEARARALQPCRVCVGIHQ